MLTDFTNAENRLILIGEVDVSHAHNLQITWTAASFFSVYLNPDDHWVQSSS
jgi:hypothetical protein